MVWSTDADDGGVQYTGGYHEYTGCVQYSGRIDTMSTAGGVQYTGEIP